MILEHCGNFSNLSPKNQKVSSLIECNYFDRESESKVHDRSHAQLHADCRISYISFFYTNWALGEKKEQKKKRIYIYI